MPDSIHTLLSYFNTPRNDGGFSDIYYPLISDFSKEISKSYDVLLPEGMTLRATFIIDPEGIVQFGLAHSNYMSRNVAEILRNIDALQYVIKNKVVCPESWVPGKDTIAPDPEKKLVFFKKHVKGHL